MKILVLDSVYAKAKSLIRNQKESPNWDDELEESGPVGNGSELASAFRQLGITSTVITITKPPMELSNWQERILDRSDLVSRLPIGANTLFSLTGMDEWLIRTISRLGPSHVYCLAVNALPVKVAAHIKSQGIILVGQIASPLPPKRSLSNYSHMFTAMPCLREKFHEIGLSSSHLLLGYNPSTSSLSKDWREREISTIFIGSLGRHHKNSFAILSAAAEVDPGLRIYAPSRPKQLKKLGLDQNYFGEAFGRKMFALLGNSRLVLNRHAGFATGLSANLRMYEASGMGASLLTEENPSLYSIFPRGDVFTYDKISDVRDVVALARDDDPKIREAAQKAQRTTMSRHTVMHRAKEVLRVMRGLPGKVQ